MVSFENVPENRKIPSAAQAFHQDKQEGDLRVLGKATGNRSCFLSMVWGHAQVGVAGKQHLLSLSPGTCQMHRWAGRFLPAKVGSRLLVK
jgi:hypothetical protein